MCLDFGRHGVVYHDIFADVVAFGADQEQFARLDKEYILKVRRENYGYACLTDQKQYYRENYPDIVVERGNLDEVIAMMIGGEDL